jgi:hypothetical protein
VCLRLKGQHLSSRLEASSDRMQGFFKKDFQELLPGKNSLTLKELTDFGKTNFMIRNLAQVPEAILQLALVRQSPKRNHSQVGCCLETLFLLLTLLGLKSYCSVLRMHLLMVDLLQKDLQIMVHRFAIVRTNLKVRRLVSLQKDLLQVLALLKSLQRDLL